ncbi:MAG: hypothetical protein M3Q65_18890 [Chloroflexota bacterium]|nr:hypothetical protein [Chloroflexota bacterium]
MGANDTPGSDLGPKTARNLSIVGIVLLTIAALVTIAVIVLVVSAFL